MFPADAPILGYRIAPDSNVGRLAVFVKAIIDQKLGDMPDSAPILPKPQNQIRIAAIQIVAMPVSTQPVIDRSLKKERRMHDVANAAEAQDIVIVTGLFSPKNRLPILVHVHDIAKEAIPIRMLLKALGDF
jgi:hypothetical protein